MKAIHLHGALAEFGGPFEMAVSTPAEALRAMTVQLDGFAETLRDGTWQVIRGPLEEGVELDEESLTLGLGKAQEMHILPAIEGAGSNGVGKAILGAAIIAVAWWNPAGWAAGTAMMVGAAGAGMLVAGTAMMLAPSPPTGSYEDKGRPDETSFLFNGPVNTHHQGVPVPLVYGETHTGSVVVSAGMSTERIL